MQLRSGPRRAPRGFTLIELLVVVAIIAVLISILLPSLSKARAQAKQLLCNTQLRAMGEAAAFYAAEHNDWFVRHNDDDARMHFSASLLTSLKPKQRVEFSDGTIWDEKIKNLWDATRPQRLVDVCAQIPQFQCPAHPEPTQKLDYVVNGYPWPYTSRHAGMDRMGPPGDRWAGQTGRHWVNFFRSDGLGKDGMFEQVRPDRTYSLSEKVYIVEGHRTLPPNELRYHDLFYASQLPFGPVPRIANDQRHPGGINGLLFDGSARVFSLRHIDSGYGHTIGHRLRWFAPVDSSLF